MGGEEDWADARARFRLVTEEDHYEYLILQKGELSLFSDRPDVWKRMYIDSLFRDYHTLKPFLPEYCGSVLDVGSGLGGINIMISRHYEPMSLQVDLLDGADDKPVVTLHRITFNSMAVAKDFLSKNGVLNVNTFTPDQVRSNEARPQHRYDLVISLGSWCFHYPPDTYLRFVKQYSHANTMIILDVRNEEATYWRQLMSVFREVGTAWGRNKFRRVVFQLK